MSIFSQISLRFLQKRYTKLSQRGPLDIALKAARYPPKKPKNPIKGKVHRLSLDLPL